MKREYALDAFTVGNAANREHRVQSTAFFANDDTCKNLDTLFVALDHAGVNLHTVAHGERREVGLELFLLNFVDNDAHKKCRSVKRGRITTRFKGERNQKLRRDPAPNPETLLVGGGAPFYSEALTSSLSPSDLTVLYQFSVALAGLNEEAEHLVHEVLEDKLPGVSKTEPSSIPLLRALWNARPEPKGGGDAPISNLPPQFQWMKTRDRAVATLLSFKRFSEKDIAAICGPGESPDPAAVERAAAALETIPVSAELLNRFAVTMQGASPPFRLLSPLGLALLFAALVLLAVASWIWLDWKSKADEILSQKFIHAVEDASPAEFESIDAPVGELTDVLFLKYGLENYPLPAAFATLLASKVGVGSVDGHPVVEIRLKNQAAWLILFRAADFGLESNDDHWKTAGLDGWSLAMRSQNSQGQVVTLHGSSSALSALLPP